MHPPVVNNWQTIATYPLVRFNQTRKNLNMTVVLGRSNGTHKYVFCATVRELSTSRT
jgi:hypothetical protein